MALNLKPVIQGTKITPPKVAVPSKAGVTAGPVAKIIPQGTVRRTAGATTPILSQPHTQNNSVYAALNQRQQRYLIL